MRGEYYYYNYYRFKEYINLEMFGMAIDYLKQCNKESKEMGGDYSNTEQMVDELADFLYKNKSKIFNRNTSKNELRDILNHEILYNDGKFGENLKTLKSLNVEILKNNYTINGFYDGFTLTDEVRGDGLFLINQMKGLGTKEAFDRFLGKENKFEKTIGELTSETLENNSDFEELVRKLIKKDVSTTEFQKMIEMYIKRNLAIGMRLDIVAQMLAKGFGCIASKLRTPIPNVLTNEDMECLAKVEPRILFNIGVARQIVKEKDKEKKRDIYLSKIEEQKKKGAETLQGKDNDSKSLTPGQHCVAINDQIRNLAKIVNFRRKNIGATGTKDSCYIFDVIDFLMANRYSLETLKIIVKEKIDYFNNHPVYGFYENQLQQVLEFLLLVERHSKKQPIEQSFSYIIDGKIVEATEEQMAIAENYLKENKVVVNPYTMSTVLRRLIIGGDINSKFPKNCLQVKKNIKERNNISIK